MKQHILLAAISLASTFNAYAELPIGVNQSIPGISQTNTSRPLTIVHIGTQEKIKFQGGYNFLHNNANQDPNLLAAMIGWSNVLRLKFGGSGSTWITELQVIDEIDEFIRTEAWVQTQANFLNLADATGEILGFSGTGAWDVSGSGISGALTGGRLQLQNAKYRLSEKTIYADVNGLKYQIGTTPAVNYIENNVPMWTYETLTGPRKIPVEALKTSTNRQATMLNAGFKVWSQSQSQIIFKGTYKFAKLRLTPQGKLVMKNSLGVLNTFTNALNLVNEDPAGLGEVEASVFVAVSL